MNTKLLDRAATESTLVLKTQNHLLYSHTKDKFEGVYLDGLSKLNTKNWEHVCTMKEYYERKREDAKRAYLAACDTGDKKAEIKWLKEYNNYDKRIEEMT